MSGEKKVVLGLVMTKRTELENKDAVIARIYEAAKYLPLDRLCLSPQCGFARDVYKRQTPLYVTYEMIKALAERYGTRVIESEIVGLTPAKALIDCAEFYLKAKDFDCKKQVMEYHLIDME